jgi:hypothetical protein
MIDIETVGTGPEACILTIAAQTFEPLETGYSELSYYARVDFESQPGRNIEDGTIQWWATQPAEAREEAFNENDRIPLAQALEELGRIIWTCKQRTKDNAARIWANGPTFDMNFLEHAYIVRLLEPFYHNIGKRLVKSPKIYLGDTGLLHSLLEVERFEDLFVVFEETVGPSEGFVGLFDASFEIVSRALVDFNNDSKSAMFAFSNVAIISVVALPIPINAEAIVS